jgi:hypothetical protein
MIFVSLTTVRIAAFASLSRILNSARAAFSCAFHKSIRLISVPLMFCKIAVVFPARFFSYKRSKL